MVIVGLLVRCVSGDVGADVPRPRGGHRTGDLAPPTEVLGVAGDVLHGEVRDQARRRGAVARDEAVGDVVPTADDGELVEHLVGDRRRDAVQIAGLQAIVELRRRPLETEVVELERIVLRRAVEADLGARPTGEVGAFLGGVAGDDERRDQQVDRVGGPTRAGGAVTDRRQQTSFDVLQRVQGMDVHPVGHLTGHRRHPRSHRGHVDLDVPVLVGGRPPLVGQQRQLVVRPVVGQLAVATKCGQAVLHCQEVVLHPRAGRVEGHAVAPLDVRLHLAAEPEPEPAAGVAGQLPGDRCRHHRADRERHGDARRERQRRRRARRCGDAHPRRLARFGEQHPREAGPFHPAGQLGRLGPANRTNHHIEFHDTSMFVGRDRSGHRRAIVRPSSGHRSPTGSAR